MTRPPLVPTDADLEGWSERQPWAFSLARAWSAHAPRTKSWLPRKLGRILGSNWRFVVRGDTDARIAVDPSNLDIYTQIARDGAQDPWVLRTCLRLLEPGGVFFDVGANAGFIALSVGAHFRDEVEVVAFEPQPGLARTIAISARLNGLTCFRVFDVMLGATDGEAKLYLVAHALHASAIARETGAMAIDRPAARIDSLVEAGAVPAPTVVKIDVEGAELDVLRGAERLLRERSPSLVIETNENMERFGYDSDELLGFIASCGEYSFRAIRADGSLADLDDDATSDILATPPGRLLA